MIKARKNMIRRALASLLCAAVVLAVMPVSAFAEGSILALPASVSLTNYDGTPFVTGQDVTPGKEFYITYNYGTVGPVNSEAKYSLPTLSNQLEVVHAQTEDELITLAINGSDDQPLGTLEINTRTAAMTFQFHERFNGYNVDDFFLKFGAMLDEDAVEIGTDIVLTFPVQDGNASFDVTVVDAEKDKPTVKKRGALWEGDSESGHIEVLWTITVTNGTNPHRDISIHDTWNKNLEYVDGSLCKDGVPVSEGLTLNSDGMGFRYECTDMVPNSECILTYRTRIKSSAFLKNNMPLVSGNISCTNTAQAYYPDGSDIALSASAAASYSHPIRWLYKTSGDIIDRKTGEMEWTITIYNNGLAMQNVVLYDRLSPGVKIKDNTATMQIGNGPVRTLTDFARIDDEDLLYNGMVGKEYNVTYPLGSIGNVTVIKYRTVIVNPTAYDAGANLPPDSIFDNRAFITYQLPIGEGLSSVIASPVVEKSGGYDTGLIGKKGEHEAAYHTIKWTITVNSNNESLTGVTVTDRLTYADPISADENGVYKLPKTYRLCNHVYVDGIDRNEPQYRVGDGNLRAVLPYDPEAPNEPFTYRLVPISTAPDADVYEIVFYLGSINEEVTIVFRSTATDEIIYANNVTGTNCHYENRATLITDGNEFSYASADVVYTSKAFQKVDARSWYNKTEHSYNFEENQLPWLMIVNSNRMEMTNICITDILNPGTSLVDGAMILGTGEGAWYKLSADEDTVAIPELAPGVTRPYYTYDEGSRELKIYLEDIVGSDVGTDDAIKQIVFYVHVDVDHPVFNDPSLKEGYIPLKNGTWTIPNSGSLENNYLSKKNAVVDNAAYNIPVQHLSKGGTAYKNGEYYSIDYTLGVNRIQSTLPDPAVVCDILPAGLRLDASTVRLYEATAISPDMFHVNDKGANGKLVKGAEIDPTLYQVETVVSGDGTTTMRITLPAGSGSSMYIIEYSCDVTNTALAPFTNSASIEGVVMSKIDQTTTRLLLTSASGGGTLGGREKTTITVTKTGATQAIPVEGAVFGIYYEGTLLEERTTDENGIVVFTNLNEGFEYTVTELRAGPGYLSPINVTATVTATGIEDPVTLEFSNTPITGTVRFIKTDPDGEALAGAAFGIWASAADVGVTAPFATAESDENGAVLFYSLTAGSTYYIAETAAPSNFQLSDKVIVVRMNLDGAAEKLWLLDDESETAITAFENSRAPQAVLTVSKAVTGNMGNRTTAFAFTLNIDANANLPAGTELQGVKTAADGNETAVTVSVGEQYAFTLTHGESLTVNGLPTGTQYAVSENDYSADGYATAYVTTRNGTAAQSVTGNTAAGVIADGANSEAFTNHADIPVPTGVRLNPWPSILIILLAAVGCTMLLSGAMRRFTDAKE